MYRNFTVLTTYTILQFLASLDPYPRWPKMLDPDPELDPQHWICVFGLPDPDLLVRGTDPAPDPAPDPDPSLFSKRC